MSISGSTCELELRLGPNRIFALLAFQYRMCGFGERKRMLATAIADSRYTWSSILCCVNVSRINLCSLRGVIPDLSSQSEAEMGLNSSLASFVYHQLKSKRNIGASCYPPSYTGRTEVKLVVSGYLACQVSRSV